MPLASTVGWHRVFFEVPALLLDTCVLVELADRPNGMEQFESLLRAYAILIPTVAIYELNFGPRESANANALDLEARLHKVAFATHTEDVYAYETRRRERSVGPGLVVVNPSISEWVSARNRLVRKISQHGGNFGKEKRRHSFDALIHACARNRFAPVCTINIDDFEHLNRSANAVHYERGIPLFTLDQALASLDSEVVYSAP